MKEINTNNIISIVVNRINKTQNNIKDNNSTNNNLKFIITIIKMFIKRKINLMKQKTTKY